MSADVTGTNRSSCQARQPIENDEERLAMKRDDYTYSASTSSSTSTFSDCFDENESHGALEMLVNEVSTANVPLSCRFAFDFCNDEHELA